MPERYSSLHVLNYVHRHYLRTNDTCRFKAYHARKTLRMPFSWTCAGIGSSLHMPPLYSQTHEKGSGSPKTRQNFPRGPSIVTLELERAVPHTHIDTVTWTQNITVVTDLKLGQTTLPKRRVGSNRSPISSLLSSAFVRLWMKRIFVTTQGDAGPSHDIARLTDWLTGQRETLTRNCSLTGSHKSSLTMMIAHVGSAVPAGPDDAFLPPLSFTFLLLAAGARLLETLLHDLSSMG